MGRPVRKGVRPDMMNPSGKSIQCGYRFVSDAVPDVLCGMFYHIDWDVNRFGGPFYCR